MRNELTHSTHNGSIVPQGIHVVAKPMDPVCNFACEYSFYLDDSG